MAITLSDEARGLFDGKNFATVATLNADGSPQTAVVWVRLDGDDVLFTTVRGRVNELNLARDPRVSLVIADREDTHRYVEIQGSVTISEPEGRALILELAKTYTGQTPELRPEKIRVAVRLTPDKVTGL